MEAGGTSSLNAERRWQLLRQKLMEEKQAGDKPYHSCNG